VLRSNTFTIDRDFLTFRIGGGRDIDNLHLTLHLAGGGELFRASGHDAESMRDAAWDVENLRGQQVYLEIADLSVTGHLNVDWIQGTDTPPVIGVADQPAAALTPLRVIPLASPGPAPSRFRVTLDRQAPLQFVIFDASGRPVRSIDLGRVAAGEHQVTWDGRVENGRHAPRGVYFYRLAAPHAEARGRLVLVP
jgi:hypothetical protein